MQRLLLRSPSWKLARSHTAPSSTSRTESAPSLTVLPLLPGPLARGVVYIPYRLENLRILSVGGAAARNLSPRVLHLHITLDEQRWQWVGTRDRPLPCSSTVHPPGSTPYRWSELDWEGRGGAERASPGRRRTSGERARVPMFTYSTTISVAIFDSRITASDTEERAWRMRAIWARERTARRDFVTDLCLRGFAAARFASRRCPLDLARGLGDEPRYGAGL